jgi:hypothetical protein
LKEKGRPLPTALSRLLTREKFSPSLAGILLIECKIQGLATLVFRSFGFLWPEKQKNITADSFQFCFPIIP